MPVPLTAHLVAVIVVIVVTFSRFLCCLNGKHSFDKYYHVSFSALLTLLLLARNLKFYSD